MKLIENKEEAEYYLLTIEADQETLDKTYLNHFLGIFKNITVPGFRKGKAPFEVALNHVKAKGWLEEEFKRIINKTIDATVQVLGQDDKSWEDKIFGLAIDKKVKEFDFEKKLLVFEAKFEKCPVIKLGDYSNLPTLIERFDFDDTFCPVPKDDVAGEKDIVLVRLLGKDSKGEIELKYTYDAIEIDLEKSQIRKEILDLLLGSKAGEKQEIKLQEKNEEINVEIGVLEVREKKIIDEDLMKKFNLPETMTIENVKTALKEQYEIQKDLEQQRDLVKWIVSRHNLLEPVPIENLKFEAYKLHQKLVKRGGNNFSLEEIVLENIRNLKTSLVLEAIADKEGFLVNDETKTLFIKDVTEKPWLYGNQKPEDIFNKGEEVVNDFIKQHQALKFLLKRWTFSN